MGAARSAGAARKIARANQTPAFSTAFRLRNITHLQTHIFSSTSPADTMVGFRDTSSAIELSLCHNFQVWPSRAPDTSSIRQPTHSCILTCRRPRDIEPGAWPSHNAYDYRARPLWFAGYNASFPKILFLRVSLHSAFACHSH